MAEDKKSKEDAKPADKKPTRREAMYDKGKKNPEPKTTPNDDAGKAKPEQPTVDEDEPANPLVDAHAAMVKRQETERRDLHASHRNDHRLMATRHEGEMSALMGAAPAGSEGVAPAPAEAE